MKVYILRTLDYEDQTIEGVYASAEAAMAGLPARAKRRGENVVGWTRDDTGWIYERGPGYLGAVWAIETWEVKGLSDDHNERGTEES